MFGNYILFFFFNRHSQRHRFSCVPFWLYKLYSLGRRIIQKGRKLNKICWSRRLNTFTTRLRKQTFSAGSCRHRLWIYTSRDSEATNFNPTNALTIIRLSRNVYDLFCWIRLLICYTALPKKNIYQRIVFWWHTRFSNKNWLPQLCRGRGESSSWFPLEDHVGRAVTRQACLRSRFSCINLSYLPQTFEFKHLGFLQTLLLYNIFQQTISEIECLHFPSLWACTSSVTSFNQFCWFPT
jgi:hypothetical protein